MTKNITLSFCVMLFAPFMMKSQVVSTLWNSSTEGITDALLLDEEGNLYGADYNGDKIYILSPQGDLTIFAEGLNTPNGLAFDSAGNLLVCDNVGNRIYTIDPEGNFLDTVFISSPSGIIKTLDSDTMIFTQYTGNTLNKLSPDGVIIQTHEGGVLDGPVGLAYDDEGELYIGNFNDRMIYRVEGPELIYVATVPGSGLSDLGFIAFGNGLLWGTSFQADEIYQIEPNYVDSVILYAGSSPGNMNGPLAEATFDNPNGIILNAAGDSIYISQYPGGEIRLISDLPALGQQEFIRSYTEIFPNPAHDQIQIKSERQFDHLELMDVLGNLVMDQSWNIKRNTGILDVSGLKNGIYFLRLQDASLTISEKKLVRH